MSQVIIMVTESQVVVGLSRNDPGRHVTQTKEATDVGMDSFLTELLRCLDKTRHGHPILDEPEVQLLARTQ
jgi:hypothetical protein